MLLFCVVCCCFVCCVCGCIVFACGCLLLWCLSLRVWLFVDSLVCFVLGLFVDCFVAVGLIWGWFDLC